MKNILIAAMIVVAFVAKAGQPLTVIDQDYELAKRTALQQHKLLIVDFYTTWCVPCKMLDNAIFKNDSIVREISKDFVVLRYDAEKDSVHNLSLKHHVCSYPTTIVLTGEGKVIHKMYGIGRPERIVESYAALLRESLSRNKQGKYLEGFSAPIDSDIYPAFYKKYVRRIADISPGDLDNYWKGNSDLLSEVSLDILAYFGKAPDHVITHFVQYKAEYEKRFGKADVQFIINRIVSEKFNCAVTAKDEAGYKAAVKMAKQHLSPADASKYISTYSLEIHVAKGDWNKAADLVEEQVRRNSIDKSGINSFCWTVYEQCNDKKVVDRAVHLMKNIKDIDSSFAMLDTYARLLSRMGRNQEAITVMKRAIVIGKANNEDTQESEEALSKF